MTMNLIKAECYNFPVSPVVVITVGAMYWSFDPMLNALMLNALMLNALMLNALARKYS